jgi:2-dehydro-3-deoxygalactonokinase
MTGDWLAIDWGSTSVRAWRVDKNGLVLRQKSLPLGVSRLKQEEVAQKFVHCVRPNLDAEGLPAILCGMVGSNRGWTVVPYICCPATTEDLSRGLVQVEAKPIAEIVPGLVCQNRLGPDVARGEETQIVGWLEKAPERQRDQHVLCLPGTHSKWVLVEDGRVEEFVTAMSGELFDLLSNQSLLSAPATPLSMEAFDAGLVSASDGGALSARLFGVRARVAAGTMTMAHQQSYLSGLLVGAEVASLPKFLRASPNKIVHLIGAPSLTELYARALKRWGVSSIAHDGAAMVLAGLSYFHTRMAQR